MSAIKVYFADDDSLVSEAPIQANAVRFSLRSDLEQTDYIRLYAKTGEGEIVAGVEIKFVGDNAAKWEVAVDDSGSPGAWGAGPLALGTVTNTPIYFWIRGSVLQDEAVQRDLTVKCRAIGDLVIGPSIEFDVTGNSAIEGVEIFLYKRVFYESTAITSITPSATTFADNYFWVGLGVEYFTFYDNGIYYTAELISGEWVFTEIEATDESFTDGETIISVRVQYGSLEIYDETLNAIITTYN